MGFFVYSLPQTVGYILLATNNFLVKICLTKYRIKMKLEINSLAFFNLGPWEILFILMVILILFGAKRLPELARGLGKGINEFKDAVNTSKKEIIDNLDTNSKKNTKIDSDQ